MTTRQLGETRLIRVAMYPEPPVCPRTIFDLDPRETHSANVRRSTRWEDIASLELAHIGIWRLRRSRRLPHQEEGSPRGARVDQFIQCMHFCTDGAKRFCCLSPMVHYSVPVGPVDYPM